MKVVIIVFSPSGSTLKVATLIKERSKKYSTSVRLLNITKKDEFLFDRKRKENFQKKLRGYDLLFIGGPVYAGHIESNIKKIIKLLPLPNENYSNLAIPFITYGGSHSSIALEEMGVMLKEKQYKSILGIKIVSKHTLTQTYTKVMNSNRPNKEDKQIIIKAVDYIFGEIEKGKEHILDKSVSFEYSPIKERELFQSLSQQKLHENYKTVNVNQEKCIKCMKCVIACPVNVLRLTKNRKVKNLHNDRCILCAECFHSCPVGAINFSYIEKARERLKDGFGKLEQELSRTYPDVDSLI